MGKRFMNVLASLGLGVLAMGLLAACGTDAGTADLEQQVAGLQTQVGELEAQLQALAGGAPGAAVQPTVMVNPAFYKYPAAPKGEGELWFYGSGLEPGQWYGLTIEAEGKVASVDSLADDALRQANDTGTFAVTLSSIKPDDGHPLNVDLGERGGVFVVNLWDADTDVILASTPFVVCGSNGENPWCDAAQVSATVPEPGGAGAGGAPTGTIYTLDEFKFRDGLMELRMGDTTAWGYDAGETIRSGPRGDDPGRDIVVTISVGDALVFPNGLTSSGSSSTETHFFTIDELGINEAIDPGEDTNFGYTLSPPEPGTYRIYCSAHPDAHGSVVLIVQ